MARFSLSSEGIKLLRELQDEYQQQVEHEAELEADRILEMSDDELLVYVIFERDENPGKVFQSSKALIDNALAAVFWCRPEYPRMMDEEDSE